MRQRGENSLRAGASVPELAGRRGKSLGWPQTKAGEGEGAFFGVIDPFFVLVASTDEPVGGIRHSHRGVFDAWHFLWVFSPGASISPFTGPACPHVVPCLLSEPFADSSLI